MTIRFIFFLDLFDVHVTIQFEFFLDLIRLMVGVLAPDPLLLLLLHSVFFSRLVGDSFQLVKDLAAALLLLDLLTLRQRTRFRHGLK